MDSESAASIGSKSCPFPVKCFNFMKLQVDDATGFLCVRFANGAVIMSNVFLSTALITLAKRSLGCQDEDEVCDGTVYGFKPSSLITIIATISGLLAAFLLPLLGAIVDTTPHRKLMGITFAVLLIAIQAIQIWTVQATWFPMAILQAINGFFYQGLTLAIYAYLPEIKQMVTEETMTNYSSKFYMGMFSMEALYLILVIGLSLVVSADDVLTGQMGQGIDALVSGFFYWLGFYFFTHKEPKRELSEGSNLLCTGFTQVFQTSKGIFQHYPKTLGWFFVAIIFAESAVNSFTTVAVTFLSELGFSGTLTGVVFLEVLISTIPGSLFSQYLVKRLNSPLKCMKINIVVFIAINFVAFLLLGNPKMKNVIWVFGALWGFMLGWFYPIELNLFSALMPKGQEAELAGFFLYCTQILGWLPPLVFTLFNENPDISISWGGVQLNIWLFLALVCYMMMPSWSRCKEITEDDNKILKSIQLGTMHEAI